MNNYIVCISIYVGGFEKATYTIITDAPNREAAGRYALLLECHNSPDMLDWDKDDYESVEDGLDFIYELNSIAKLDDITPFNDAGMHSSRYSPKFLEDADIPVPEGETDD